MLKRSLYEDSGVPSYWVLDPDEQSCLVLELEAGRYVERARATGTAMLVVTAPFSVTITPDALLS